MTGQPETRRHARRTWLVAGAATAMAAGAGVALWRSRTAGPDVDRLPWSLQFERPDGSRLAMASFVGQPLVLNFWATWCPPCVREMPSLDRFQRDFRSRGWRVAGIAADRGDAVRSFLARTPVSFDIGLAGFAGIDLSRQLGNEGGGLPYTMVFDHAGRPVQRHAGETDYERLAEWARQYS